MKPTSSIPHSQGLFPPVTVKLRTVNSQRSVVDIFQELDSPAEDISRILKVLNQIDVETNLFMPLK